jgi:hypothetical protein
MAIETTTAAPTIAIGSNFLFTGGFSFSCTAFKFPLKAVLMKQKYRQDKAEALRE